MLLNPNIPEIKRRRELAGLSLHKLSLQAGLTDTALHYIESGKTKKINHLRAREIARVLGCNVEDICSVPERNA